MAVIYNGHTEKNGKVEMIFAIAGNARREAMPGGWCDNAKIDISGGGDYCRYYDFMPGEYYLEQVHLPHGANFGMLNGLVDFDLHFWNINTETGIARFKVSLWHLYTGRILSGLTDPDVTYTQTLNFTSGVAKKLSAAYVEDAIDCSAWQANRTPHDGMLYKLERLSDGDTKYNGIAVFHQELWFPHDGTLQHMA